MFKFSPEGHCQVEIGRVCDRNEDKVREGGGTEGGEAGNGRESKSVAERRGKRESI